MPHYGHLFVYCKIHEYFIKALSFHLPRTEIWALRGNTNVSEYQFVSHSSEARLDKQTDLSSKSNQRHGVSIIYEGEFVFILRGGQTLGLPRKLSSFNDSIIKRQTPFKGNDTVNTCIFFSWSLKMDYWPLS